MIRKEVKNMTEAQLELLSKETNTRGISTYEATVAKNELDIRRRKLIVPRVHGGALGGGKRKPCPNLDVYDNMGRFTKCFK